MLKGYFFIMYIHNKLLYPKQTPQNENCQFQNPERQNAKLQSNGSILASPNFNRTCPIASNALCKTANPIKLNIPLTFRNL